MVFGASKLSTIDLQGAMAVRRRLVQLLDGRIYDLLYRVSEQPGPAVR